MAHMTLRQALTPLRAAAVPDSDLVHLIAVTETVPVQQTLCRARISSHPPQRLLAGNGCPRCVDVALDGGIDVAEDRHGALVNLRRLARTRAKK